MKKHLEKIKLCDRTLDSYKYKDDELYVLSLTRIYNINKNVVCKICNKEFKNIFTLNRHKSIFHKCNNESDSKDNNINDENNNIINNNVITNNNISINVIHFEDNLNTSYINNKQKILLSSTLENILENELNLNVLTHKISENTLEKINIKDIVNKTMIKLTDSLNKFKHDVYQKNNHHLDLNIIDHEKDDTYKICKLIGY